MLKKLATGLIVLVCILVAVAYMLPRDIPVTRSADIDAPPETVYALVAAPRDWTRWSPWTERDPDMQITYTGPASGDGATWTWISEKEGNGSMTFTSATPPNALAYTLTFEGMGPPSSGAFNFEPTATGTRVTWHMDVDMGNSPVGRWFGLMMPSMLGGDFDAGLAKLKSVAEADAANAPTAAPATDSATTSDTAGSSAAPTSP